MPTDVGAYRVDEAWEAKPRFCQWKKWQCLEDSYEGGGGGPRAEWSTAEKANPKSETGMAGLEMELYPWAGIRWGGTRLSSWTLTRLMICRTYFALKSERSGTRWWQKGRYATHNVVQRCKREKQQNAALQLGFSHKIFSQDGGHSYAFILREEKPYIRPVRSW